MKWFLGTRIGLSIRATGDNRDMVSASSIDPRHTITLGLVIANCLTGLSGALAGQMQKSADINGGTGIVVIGLACLIIGETVIHGRKNMTRNILACFVGNVIYRMIYAVILRTSIIPIECLKLVTALIVAIAIACTDHQGKYEVCHEG
jgi:putative ABC transport system permease protein